MLYKDTIREKEFLKLADQRGICVSIYLPTTPLTQDAQADRIVLKNLTKTAMEQAEAIADKRQIQAMTNYLEELLDDDEFWKFLANGLGILVTPESIRTYRLSYTVEEAVEVSDRFYLKPLMSALQPISAYVLAISQKSVKLYEFTPAQELEPLDVSDLPANFSAVTQRTLQRDRAPARKLQGDEGAEILQRQFLRAIEKAVRPVVSGSNMPLILATTQEFQAMYQSFNSYDMLATKGVNGSVEGLPEEEIRQAIPPIVKELRQERIQQWIDLYHQRQNESRTSTDLATIAKLVTRGQVSHLLVDADAVQYGTLTDIGEMTTSDIRSAETYDLIDEIVVRVIQNGGEVLGVRKGEDAPEELMPIAAILRWA
ncbi:MAG: hypothetical protein IGS39_03345 [Calothrix sp. C42_A2020_038]|nr:hypothetical protein [Calothrix sp. C42_A2020_038]